MDAESEEPGIIELVAAGMLSTVTPFPWSSRCPISSTANTVVVVVANSVSFGNIGAVGCSVDGEAGKVNEVKAGRDEASRQVDEVFPSMGVRVG